ncbi:MAG: flagellar export protein FliJ [Cycloclasticus sp.]|nr:flagellar export protein FliJ [Cycloclasticus sp.]
MLKKSKRLEPVKKIAENKEAAAAVKVAKSVLEKEASVDQLEKLRGYREDYIVQFKTKGQSGMSASRLQDYQAFVHKLDSAIEEQIRAVQGKHKQVDEHQQSFQKTNSQKKAVEKLIDKRVKQETIVEQRQEQNEADDRPSGGGSQEDVLRWRFN